MQFLRRFLRRAGANRVSRRQDYDRVAPWLLLGPALDEAGYRTLAREGVTHVLDLRSERSDDPELMRSLALDWLQVPIDDQMPPTHEQLAVVSRWLDASSSPTPPVVYIHCEGGLGRSPTLAVALLMQRGYTRAEAHRLVATARSIAAPTDAQHAWLDELDGVLSRRSPPPG